MKKKKNKRFIHDWADYDKGLVLKEDRKLAEESLNFQGYNVIFDNMPEDNPFDGILLYKHKNYEA